MKLPAIVSCDLRLNTPRFANLPSIMKARKKRIDILEVEKLGLDISPRQKQIKVTDPPVRQAGQKIETAEILVEHLKKQGLV